MTQALQRLPRDLRLGDSELEVSRIALGSWRTFERMPRAEAERVLAHALERGICFFDDARYNDESGQAPLQTGWSEVLFGELTRAVGMDRERVVVANKLWWEFWPREDAVAELHGSLERMRFDRLDLLYASTLPDDLPVAVAVEQIANVLATGLVGAWGIVNWSAAALAAAADEARRLGIPMPCAVQLPYSLAQTEWVEDPEMEAALAAAGASLIPSATLAGGALSGKYSVGGGGRLGGETDRPSHQRAISIGARLVAEADRLNTTAASLAIAFTLLHPRTAATLVGATAPWQLDQAIEAVALSQRLSEDDRARLRSLGEAGG